MPRRHRARLTDGQRQLVIELMLSGESAAAAARTIGCDYRAVMRWWTRWLDGRDQLQDERGGRGRPRETTEEEDARIRQYAEEHVFCTAGEIKEALGLLCGEEVIRRYVLLTLCLCFI